ncbi:MAG: P-loop NTPase fold protein [Sphingobacteriaceae bacterium]
MWADNETSEDLLGFKVHADLLIDVIKDDKVLPVTIGVFGDWGSGKSSILKIVNEELIGVDGDLKDGTLVLYFNGWVFEGYDDAKAALLESIIKAFEEHKTIGNKVKDKTKKLLKSVKWMRTLGFGFKKVVLPSAAAYFTGGVSLIPFLAQELSKVDPKDLTDKLTGEKAEDFLKEIINTKEEDETTLVRAFREDFKSMIDKSEIKKLVVIIDDLDRCTPDRIIENLEAIKLFLNVDKTAFIIGADPRIVRHAIEFRYKTQGKVEEDSNNRIVEDYLEKLIQIPYNLPKLSDSEVETYISLLICKRELSEEMFKKVFGEFQKFRSRDRYSVYGLAAINPTVTEDAKKQLSQKLTSIPSLVPVITQTLSGNPRQVKRFLNTLTLRQRLASVAKLPDFNDTILAKLMVLEYSELALFRQLYDWQVSQKGEPDQIKTLEKIVKEKNSVQEIKVEIEKIDGIKNWNKERVINWLKVEPSLAGVDLSDYFWLSRDKIAATIPGVSLIPPVIRALYQQLDQDSMPDAVSKKIIKEQVNILSEFERTCFLDFCSQMLIRNPKKNRCYSIFHILMDEKIIESEIVYASTLRSVSISDVPVSVGEALKRYTSHEAIMTFVETNLKNSTTPVAKAYKSK